MSKMREYSLVNRHDPNVTIPIDATDENDAQCAALEILGWYVTEDGD